MHSTNLLVRHHMRALLQPASAHQSIRNLSYLLLAFPCGIAYFVLLVSGLTLSAALLPLGIGLPLMALVLNGSRRLIRFERWLAVHLLGMRAETDRDLPAMEPLRWRALAANIRQPAHWQGVRYLLARLPLDVATLVVLASCLTLTIGLLSAPLIYRDLPLTITLLPFARSGILIDTLPEALICAGAGVFVGVAVVWLLNALAGVYRRRALRFFEAAID